MVNPTDKNITKLSAITWFGTGILILALVVTIVVSSIFRKSTKLFLPFLCVLSSWLCLVITFAFGVAKTDSEKECRIVAAILQFFLISTYCWNLVFTYLMHKSPENENDIKVLAKAVTFALGVPIFVVLVTATTITNSYGGNQFCVPYETAFYVGVLVPVVILFIVNLYMLILDYYHMPNGVSNANHEDQQGQQKKFQGNSSDLIKALLLLMVISVVFVTAICLIEYVSTVMEVIFLAICMISFVFMAVCFIANKICGRYKNNLEIRKTVRNVSKDEKEQRVGIRLLSRNENVDTN
ncbi:adhesion G protein-coupled receptor E5-like [Hydractinia symbiolongicarpus]|nr:adhesion G protein-coupled receptor E5-like [Hydractinia symbiolongicarpus]